MLHTESRRSYSWWWDSHISPKNSKWLQENLTDMDTKVKAMIKLIEEDADSFARRAEMYYKKRPELMKLVEEFYRAYRALAERYDHATGALRQAHKTMAEAFPNQIPFALLDESPPGSSVGEVGPHTPEMPTPIRALFDPEDLHKDVLGLSSHYHAIKRNGAFSEENDLMSRKGLKQLNEMFATGEGAPHAKLAEGKVRKGLNFQEEEGKNFEHKTLNGSKEHNQNLEEKEVADKEIKCLQEEVSRLSREIQNLKRQITSESEHADKAQTEIGTLKETVSQLKSEKEAAISQCQLSMERISDLENEISRTQDDLKKLNCEMAKDVAKLHDAEERCLLLEKANQSLEISLESFEQKAQLQKYELNKKQEELEGVKLSLESIEKLHTQSEEEVKHFSLEIQSGVEKLKGVELTNMSLVQEVHHLEEQNSNLHEQTISSAQKMENLQDEILLWKERKRKLEEEVVFHVEEKKLLQHDLCHLKEDRDDLEQKHKDLIEQMEAVSSNIESLQALIKELQDGNAEFKELCEKHEEEKALHLKKLEEMEKISEKNAVLENSISDATLELEGLTNLMENSCESLRGQLSVHVYEKASLVSQLEITAQDLEKLLERNTFLEKSLSDVNAELEDLRTNLECLEESYQSLIEEKSNLLSEKGILVSQVESSTWNMEKLSRENAFLERSLYERDVALEEQKVKLKSLEESCQSLYDEKTSLFAEKHTLASQVGAFAQNIEKLSEKNAFLENSLSNSCIELEAWRVKLKDLEESFLSLYEEKENFLAEKNSLLSQFEAAAQTMEKFSENSTFLEKSLLDRNAELEDLRVRSKGLEESCQMLSNEQSNLLAEKNSLVSQVETTAKYMEELSEKNVTMGKSLSDATIEVGALSAKLKQLEESFQLLCAEKSNLLAERNTLVSQVESISQSLETMEDKFAELEEKHLNLGSEEVLMLNQLMELQECLKVEKQEHETLIQSSKYHMAMLENQIRLLQEELRLREEESEVELQRNLSSQTESLILHRFVLDMKEMNLVPSAEFQRHLKSSRDAEDLLSDLRKENNTQKIMLASLIEQIEKLRDGISVMFKALDINKDYGSSNGIRDEVLLHIIFNKIRNLLNSVSDYRDENQQLIIEKSVFLSVLQQLAVEEAGLRAAKSLLEQESEVRTKELSMIHRKQSELLQKNGQLGEDLQASVHREKALKYEIEILYRQLSDLQEDHCMSQKEISRLVKGSQSLSKRLRDLGDERDSKEAENNVILEEAMTLEFLHLIFRSLSDERASALMLVRNDVNYLVGLNNDLNQWIRALNKKMEALQEENKRLKEAHCISQKEIGELVKENQSLSKRLYHLGKEKDSEEAENNVILEEAMTQEFLHLIFSSLSDERASDLMLASNDVNCLLGLSNDLNQGISVLNQKMEELQKENMHLKELVVSLEGRMCHLTSLEDDLSRAQDHFKQLNLQIQNAKHLLVQKDLDISEANWRIQEAHQTSQGEIWKLIEEKQSLSEELYDLKKKMNEVEVENSSILAEVMTLECLHSFFRNLSAERAQELKSCNNNMNHLLGLNNDLYEEIRVFNEKMGLLAAESTNLKKSVVSLEEAHQMSQGEISKLVEENLTLWKEIYKLRDQKDAAEKENSVVLVEVLTMEWLYMFFRSLSGERGLELQSLSNELNHLCELRNALDEEIRVVNERMVVLEVENMHLKESVVYLENELKATRDICEQLNLQIENEKYLLISKDIVLSEANQMVQSTQEKNSEICRELEVLKLDIDEAKMLQEELERTILTLSEGNACKEKEITRLHDTKEMLEGEFCTLYKEAELLRSREELLTSELKKRMHELERCEEEIAALLHDIQMSTVNAAFFEEKVLECMVDCEGVLVCAMIQQQKLYEEIGVRNAYVDDLKRKLDDLDGEHRGLKDNLNAILPLIMLLWNSMISLEKHTLSLVKLQTSKNPEEKDNSVASRAYHGNHGEMKEDHITSVEPTGVSQMKKLLAKIEALQNVVIVSGNLLEKERLHSVANLNAARSKEERVAGPKLKTDDAQISKMNHGQMMKDIQLDQVSSCILYGNGSSLYRPSKIEISETDDQMLELWETAERDCNNQMMQKTSVVTEHEIDAVEEKSEYPSSELMAEKELGIDKLELPKTTIESHEEWKMKVTERLASDAQRLSVLKTSVQELMSKIESSEKAKIPITIEYNTIKAQLKEAEGAILQLIDINSKLTRKAEDYSAPSNSLVKEKEEMGTTGRKQLTERARRGSEKIGNLELELQKIHYIFLKLEEEHEGRTKAMERRSSTLLRDYLYGKRENRRRKKGVFCGCIRPKTKG